MKKGAIYPRYSSDNQKELSIEDQVRVCTEYAKKNNILIDKANIYPDAAQTGTCSIRPGLEKLLEDAKSKAFNCVLVDDLSRLSRNTITTLTLIQELSFLGITLISIADNIDSSSDESILITQFLAVSNERYVRDLAYKTVRGQLGQLYRGYTLGEYPYGYKSVPSEKTTLDKKGESKPEGYYAEIIPERAAIIRRIFNMCADGLSVSRIVKILNEENIPNRDGAVNTWASGQVARILRNKKYIGIWAWGEFETKRHPSTGAIRRAKREEALFVRDYEHLRIVPQELWERVQKKLEENKKPWAGGKTGGFSSNQNSSIKIFPHELLSGLMICFKCGGTIGQVSGNHGGYYGCIKARNHGCDNTIKVRLDLAEKMILAEVSKVLGSTDSISYVFSQVEKLSRSLISKVPCEIQNLKSRLKEESQRIENFVKFVSKGDSSHAVREALSYAEKNAENYQSQLNVLELTKKEAFQAPPKEFVTDAFNELQAILNKKTEKSALLLRRLLGEIKLRPVYPETGKAYLVALSRLQPLELFEVKRPQKGPLSSKFATNADNSTNSVFWWS